MARDHGMIEPYEDRQVRKGVISYGVSSYGYDMRVAREFRIFTNVLTGPPPIVAASSSISVSTDFRPVTVEMTTGKNAISTATLHFAGTITEIGASVAKLGVERRIAHDAALNCFWIANQKRHAD